MANKRPVVLDTATGQLKELSPPDQIDPNVLPTSASAARSFFLS